MTADDVTRILLTLMWRLPPEVRSTIGWAAGHAANTMSLWVPAACLVLACMVIGMVRLVSDG